MEESLGETARNSFTKEFRAEKRTKFFCGRNFFAEQCKVALCAAFFSKNEGEENETTAADST